MSMDERGVVRDAAEMFRTFPWFHGEGFDLLVDDLRALPADRITVVGGFRLLPDLIAPLLAGSNQAVWLIPTPEFRRTAFDRRSGDEAFWLRTSDPERALQNLLNRDSLFTTELAASAARHSLKTVSVDGSERAEEIAAARHSVCPVNRGWQPICPQEGASAALEGHLSR